MTNLSNITENSEIFEVIRLYNEMNPNNESCWKQPTFWMLLVVLATQYLKPFAKAHIKKRQRDKESRRNTSTTPVSDA